MKEKTKNNKIKKVILSMFLTLIILLSIFIVYEIVTVNNTYYIGEKNLQIPIFVYHNIVEDESKVEFDYMQTPVDIFENQVAGLIKLGYKPISYEDLYKYKNGEISIPKWSFIITFDDGYEGVYDYAFPIAKKYNVPMTVFEIDSNMGTEGYLTWKEAKEMYDSNLISIYSHGYEHVKYSKESTEYLVELTNMSYKNITEQLEDDSILKVFTYPYGDYRQDEILALEREGFIQNLTDNKINDSKKLNLSELHRCYPLNDSVFKIILKIQYRIFKYGD